MDEVADDIISIDRAMKWGFGWASGPFEMWDEIGVLEAIELMKSCDIAVPEWVQQMVDSNYTSFYLNTNNGQYLYDIKTKDYVKNDQGDKKIFFKDAQIKGLVYILIISALSMFLYLILNYQVWS